MFRINDRKKMNECEKESNKTAEGTDQLLRSTKKMKRNMIGNPTGETEIEDMEMLEMVLESPHVLETTPRNPHMLGKGRKISYRDTLQRNNPNLDFKTRENPIWEADGDDYVSEDDSSYNNGETNIA